jgi:hypothetical protein
MKPSFALDFRDDKVSLLHRSGSLWQRVGTVALDTPDLEEALIYLRSTALGLSPKGIATKLIIPNDQILYLTLDAPGPSEEERLAQVMAGLEGRTPYEVGDLAFDISGKGPQVQVAVIAKETLAEAEGFAAENRFNPVSFVAVPEDGVFQGEPWFGTTSIFASLIGEGEKVERDKRAVVYPAAEPAPQAAAEAAPEAVGSEPVEEPTQEPAPQPEIEAVQEPDPVPEPELVAEPEPEAPPAEPEPVKAEPVKAEPVKAEPEPVKSEPFRAEPPETETAHDREASERALIERLGSTLSRPIEQPLRAPLAPRPPARPEPEVEEAPMALDVPLDEPDLDEPDLDGPDLNGAEAEPQGADVIKAALSARAGSVNIAAASSMRVTDPGIGDDLPPLPSSAAMMAFASRRQEELASGKAPTLGAAKPMLPRAAVKAASPTVAKPAKSAKDSPRAQIGAPAGKRQKVAFAGNPLDVGAGRQPNPAAPARKALAKGPGGFAMRQPVRGKPRYLGLMLTVVLLFLLAMVAAWSSYTLGAWNLGSEDPVQSAQTDPAADGSQVDSSVPDIADEIAADGQDPEALADGQGVDGQGVDGQGVDGGDVAAGDGVDVTAPVDPADLAGSEIAALPEADLPEVTQPDPAATEAVLPEAAAPEVAVTEAPGPAPQTQAVTEGQTAATAAADGTQDEIFLASMDAPPAAPDPSALPLPEARGDPLPMAQPAPPPFGTVYQFQPDGAILPTPEGIITPEGVLLKAGKPKLVPAERPAAVSAAAAAAEPAAATPAVAPAVAPEAAPPEPAATVFADPALAGKLPKERPADLVPAAPSDQGSLAPAQDSRFASLRPLARPATVLSAGEAARQAVSAATISAASAVANPNASKLAVAISRKPAARPSNMNRAVEAAIAVAMQQPIPEPEPAAQPAAKANSKTAAIAAKPAAPEDDGEPDIVSAAPKIPTKAGVAKQATFKNALNLSKINLIGVYGTQSNRYALVRQPNGRYKKVKVGDSIDGGRVAAITASELRYQKGGRLIALAMPKS